MRRLLNNIKNHSNWAGYLSYKMSGGDAFTFKSRNGLQVEVPKRMMHTYKECFFDQTYTKGLPKKAYAKDQLTVVDVGANVGYFSLYLFAQNKKAKVLAFEPMPMNFDLLKKYKEENAALDFHIFNKAVSDQAGSITLHYEDTDSFTTAASIFDGKELKNKVEVPTLTLENILQENNLEKIDFLKLDCEGSEYPIVYGASDETLAKINAIAIETHEGKGAQENRDDLSSYLTQKGFQIQKQKDIIWAWK